MASSTISSVLCTDSGCDAYYSASNDMKHGHHACRIPGLSGLQRVSELVAPGGAPASKWPDLELVGRSAVHVAVHTGVDIPLSGDGGRAPLMHRMIPACECAFPARHLHVPPPPPSTTPDPVLTVRLSPLVLHENAKLAASGTDPVAFMVGRHYMEVARRAEAGIGKAAQELQAAEGKSDPVCTTTSTQFLKNLCREALAACPEKDPDESFAGILAGMLWGEDLCVQAIKDIATLGWGTWIAFAKADLLIVARWMADEPDEVRKAKAKQVSDDLKQKGPVQTIADYRAETDAAVRAWSERRREQLGYYDE